ncbi:MAG: capsular polysaccharide biosynthesis protein, partial [Cyanobium sp.]
MLVVDQTAGDLSISCGMADLHSFKRMLVAALNGHPHCRILLKSHPDVVAGRKRGCLGLSALQRPRVDLCANDGHPAA